LEIKKKIKLDLKGIKQKAKVKKEVGDLVIDEILRSLSEGKSPVKGERFKKLDAQYAKEFKGGDRTPNLELTGDMLDALKVKNTKDGIEVGIFSKKQTPKADGHNNFSGESKLPQRRFIPSEDQEFKRDIQNRIKAVVNEFKEKDRPRIETTQDGDTATLDFGSVFDDSLDDFILRALNGES
jgi:hypothetical protein